MLSVTSSTFTDHSLRAARVAASPLVARRNARHRTASVPRIFGTNTIAGRPRVYGRYRWVEVRKNATRAEPDGRIPYRRPRDFVSGGRHSTGLRARSSRR